MSPKPSAPLQHALWFAGCLWLSACGGRAAEGEQSGPPEATDGTEGDAEDAASAVYSLEGFPWFLALDGKLQGQVSKTSDGFLHADFASADRASVSTHQHMRVTPQASRFRFAARGSRAHQLSLAITGLELEGDYWADLAAGTPWLTAEFALSSEWQQYDLPLSALRASGEGMARPMGDSQGEAYWFLVSEASGLELWFADVRLE